MTDRPSDRPGTPAAGSGDDIAQDEPLETADKPHGYGAALAELESILRELDGEDIDVDLLGQRVRRAAELLHFCRDRITSARFEVEQVVAGLETEEETG